MRVLLRRSSGTYVEDLLEEELERTALVGPDRGLCQELTYGVVRWQAPLDWLVARRTSGRIQKELLQVLLRMGLYQIFWLDRIPPHAAVNETVELARRHGLGPQAGFVNALLRGCLREADEIRQLLRRLREEEPARGYSHPQWLWERWAQRWGRARAVALMEWNNAPPPTCARVNTLKTDPGALLARWREENVEYDFIQRDWLEENLVFELKSAPPLSRLASFQEGGFYVQDPSTLLAVTVMDPRPGEQILDLCAAPGGKLAYAAQRMRNEGRLVAYDSKPARRELIRQNCARLGVQIAAIAEAVEPSGARLAGAALPMIHRFDRVLVDAPCSNTGVMRRRVDLRWRLRAADIGQLAESQVGLVRQAAGLVKPGGVLVYSTCSLEPEENEAVIQRFLQEHSGWRLDSERLLLPFVDATDGAYVARLLAPP
jgi:16S rRNA (cytosine967-C5)-methyltransferase